MISDTFRENENGVSKRAERWLWAWSLGEVSSQNSRDSSRKAIEVGRSIAPESTTRQAVEVKKIEAAKLL